MLWKLELACAEATEDALLRAGEAGLRAALGGGASKTPQRAWAAARCRRAAHIRRAPSHTPALRPRPGASVTERSSATALAAIDHLPKELALEVGPGRGEGLGP
jgi:hypothetical protein